MQSAKKTGGGNELINPQDFADRIRALPEAKQRYVHYVSLDNATCEDGTDTSVCILIFTFDPEEYGTVGDMVKGMLDYGYIGAKSVTVTGINSNGDVAMKGYIPNDNAVFMLRYNDATLRDIDKKLSPSTRITSDCVVPV